MPPCILYTFKTILVCVCGRNHSNKNLCLCLLTCNGVLASMALLGHISLEAVHAVNIVLMGSEASSRQSFTAGVAHETLRVPGLVLVADPSRGDGLRGTEEHFDHHLKHYGAGISVILLKPGKVLFCIEETLHCRSTRLANSSRRTYTVIQSVLVPACSGSISWQTSCHGRGHSRCRHPWSGSSACGLAACIQSR